MKKLLKITLILLPLFLGVVTVVYLVKTKNRPQAKEKKTSIRKVRYMKATKAQVQKVVTGYGRVAPARDWTAFSEVQGKVICLGFSLFQEKDFTNLTDFIHYLKKNEDKQSQTLRKKIAHNQKLKWENIDLSSEFSSHQAGLFLQELNRVIATESLSSETLSPEENHIWKNRSYLSKHYPQYILEKPLFEIKAGYFLPPGGVVCQIDPTEYNLFIEQKEIEIEKLQIQILELQKDLDHLKRIIRLEEKRAQILEEEYERKEQLARNEAGSKSEMQRELENYLRQLNSVQETKNRIALTPIKIKNLHASIQLANSQLVQAKLNRDKTIIRTPFAIRISEENLELNQFVSLGQVLLKGYGIEEAEVLGQFQIKDMHKIFPQHEKRWSQFDFQKVLTSGAQDFFQENNIQASVTLALGEKTLPNLIWSGRVSRILSSVDINSQNVTVVVTVKGPYDNMKPGVRPPLVKDMYCKVQLLGEKLEDQFCFPRNSYQEGRFLCLEEGKLKIKNISEKAYFQDNYVVITDGLQEGDKIVLSDVFPAYNDMPISGVDTSEEEWKNYPSFIKIKEVEIKKVEVKEKGESK